MRRAALTLAVVAALAVAGAAALGLQDWLARNAIALQREAQNALAGAIRALRAGQPGAVTGFLAVCFTHGFLHALGPGHGKAVIAAYGAASEASLRRLAAIAALSSLAQAAIAVLLVYAGIWLLDGARDRVEGMATLVEPLSFLLIAVLGLMLCRRGVRYFRPRAAVAAHHDHDHSGQCGHPGQCGCGHSHGPDPRKALAAASWREASALVLGVALRPCTSALFLLILTWRFDLDLLGIVGAFVMGLGTMMVTVSAAAVAVLMRRGVLLALPEGEGPSIALAVIEMTVGAAIFLIAATTALRML